MRTRACTCAYNLIRLPISLTDPEHKCVELNQVKEERKNNCGFKVDLRMTLRCLLALGGPQI